MDFKKLNIPIKKILIVIGILIIVGSLGFNIYVGLMKFRNDAYQQGRIDILNQIKEGTRFNINDVEGNFEGTILYVPKQ